MHLMHAVPLLADLPELSRFRSRVLCATTHPSPIGRLPVIDPNNAQSARDHPEWHAYIARVYHGSRPSAT